MGEGRTKQAGFTGDEAEDPKPIPELVTVDAVERVIVLLETLTSPLFAIRSKSPWVTIPEAEKYARVAHGTIRQAIANKSLVAYQRTPTSTVLVNLADVDRWIDTWRIGGGGEDEGRDTGDGCQP